MQHSRRAFTLVELSIVLVILGLLVGGVLAGQSLIRSAELRNVLTERDKYSTALNAFREKYFGLPGDLSNAYAFWQSAGVAGCAANTTADNGGCNGDGNGQIAVGSHEHIKAWMHLALAGLAEGNFDGMGTAEADTNSPKSRLGEGTWEFNSGSLVPIAIDNPTGGIYLSMMVINGVGSLQKLTHGEQWNLDTKTDDGRANTGMMRGGDGGDCYDLDTDGNAANGNEDLFGMIAVGADKTGDCNITFILRR